jgi:hypothetical protein
MALGTARGSFLRGWRCLAIDGFELEMPDTPGNAAEFGYAGSGANRSAFPKARVVALCECGTHAFCAGQIGPIGGKGAGERSLAARLYPRLRGDELLTAARGFYSFTAWDADAASGAALCWRAPTQLDPMPSNFSATRFYEALLSAAEMPVRPRMPLADLEQTALLYLREAHLGMLVIDELHNVLAGAANARREFLNLLRFLGNECRIPLVGLGTADAYLAIRSDDQLENRFEPVILPRWRPDEQARSLLASFAASFPLRRPSPIATPEMTEYLLARCEGTIGELARLLAEAATVAITSGEEAINQNSLDHAAYRGPSERRRTFERALT